MPQISQKHREIIFQLRVSMNSVAIIRKLFGQFFVQKQIVGQVGFGIIK